MIAAVRDGGGYTFAPGRYLEQARPGHVMGLPMEPPLRMAVTLSWTGVPSVGLQRLRDAVTGAAAVTSPAAAGAEHGSTSDPST